MTIWRQSRIWRVVRVRRAQDLATGDVHLVDTGLSNPSSALISIAASTAFFTPPHIHNIMFVTPLLRNAGASSSKAATASAFSQAHKSYVKSLYRRYLKNSLDWCIRRDVWRDRATEIRVAFERNRNIRNPRELATLFEKAEKELKRIQHPDPHRPAMFEDGTKWERNLPPPMFSEAEKKAALDAQHH